MKNILILSNYVYPHIGGSEIVLKQLSEHQIGHFNVIVCGLNINNDFIHEKVNYKKCPNNIKELINIIDNEKIDYLYIYGDLFKLWKDILVNAHLLKCKKIIVPVGLNYTNLNEINRKTFLKNINQFKVISHSENLPENLFYKDYNINYSVIHNGIDAIDDISQEEINVFKNKYNLKQENIFINVSNLFPGKGQLQFLKILSNLYKINQNWQFVFAYSIPSNNFEKQIESELTRQVNMLKLPIVLLTGLSRREIYTLYKCANVFCFSSLKEVAPLVIIESQLFSLPWISYNVGNLIDMIGGIVIPYKKIDTKGYIAVHAESDKKYLEAILLLMKDNSLKEKLIVEGKKQIKKSFLWTSIIDKYKKEIFT